MKNPNVKQTVRLIVPDTHGRVIVCKRKQNAKQRPGQWEFPGGALDKGEDTIAGGVREVGEEIGVIVDARLVEGRPVYNHYDYDSMVDQWFSRDFLLYGGRLTAGRVYEPSNEADAIAVVTIEQALDLFVDIPHQRAASRVLAALVA